MSKKKAEVEILHKCPLCKKRPQEVKVEYSVVGRGKVRMKICKQCAKKL